MRSRPRGCTRSSAGASLDPNWRRTAAYRRRRRRSRSPTRCPPSNRSCARRCSDRCWMSPSATARAARTGSRCSSRARSTGQRRSACERLAEEPHHLGALLAGPVRPRPGATSTRSRPTSSPPRACSPGCSHALGVDWDVRAAEQRSRSCIPAALPRCWSTASTVGWLGEIHPNVAAQWDFEDTVAGFEIELSAISPPAADRVPGPGQLPRRS